MILYWNTGIVPTISPLKKKARNMISYWYNEMDISKKQRDEDY